MKETDGEILPNLPSAAAVRHRLAVLLTETDLLRSLLRVSERVERERERLRQLSVRDEVVTGK
jgi:hypothetical protein